MQYPAGPRRYRLVRLTDGRIYATDNVDPARAYFLTPRPATKSQYRLAREGEVLVANGRVTGVSGKASSSGYVLVGMADGSVRFVSPTVSTREVQITRSGGLSPPGRFLVLDTRDGSLLLLDDKGVHELTVTPTSPVRAPAGNPIYQYADDFAP